jgi:four helix bundle protein
MWNEGCGMRDGFDFQRNDLYKTIIDYISFVYNISNNFPKTEIYGLSSQLRRAAVSIALNMAEGWGRYNNKEKSQFYKMARASLYECVAVYDIAEKINYINNDNYKKIIDKSIDPGLCNSVTVFEHNRGLKTPPYFVCKG